jgi:hypothetical protein
VIPSIIEYGVEAAVLVAWKIGPPPPGFGTDHARRPMRVAANATDEKMKGR